MITGWLGSESDCREGTGFSATVPCLRRWRPAPQKIWHRCSGDWPAKGSAMFRCGGSRVTMAGIDAFVPVLHLLDQGLVKRAPIGPGIYAPRHSPSARTDA